MSPVTTSQEGQTISGLGNRVRARRELLELRREDLAAKTGISMSTIARIERLGAASIGTLQILAAALDTTVGELIGEAA